MHAVCRRRRPLRAARAEPMHLLPLNRGSGRLYGRRLKRKQHDALFSISGIVMRCSSKLRRGWQAPRRRAPPAPPAGAGSRRGAQASARGCTPCRSSTESRSHHSCAGRAWRRSRGRHRRGVQAEEGLGSLQGLAGSRRGVGCGMALSLSCSRIGVLALAAEHATAQPAHDSCRGQSAVGTQVAVLQALQRSIRAVTPFDLVEGVRRWRVVAPNVQASQRPCASLHH